MKKMLLFIAILALLGCASNVADDLISTEIIADSPYAFVLAKVSGARGEYVTWLNAYKSYADDKNYAEFIKMKAKDGYQLYQVVPGRYTIIDFRLVRANTQYTANNKGRELNETMKETGALWGTFDAESGRITYIGEIDFDTQGDVTIKSDLNVAEAIQFIRENYINISNVDSVLVNQGAR